MHHLCIVCTQWTYPFSQSTDLDKYRTVVKKQIKDWHNAVVTKKNQEWLIIHVATPDTKIAGGNFFQLKGSVLDKIRADFNVDKRDRHVARIRVTLSHLSLVQMRSTSMVGEV